MLSTNQTKLVGHAGTNHKEIPMPCSINFLEISSNVLAILDKPLAEQANFLFVNHNLNSGPLSVGPGTKGGAHTGWDLATAIPADLKEDNNFPVLVLLPKITPLDNDDVQHPLQTIDNSALAWAKGIKALINNSEGLSLTGNKTTAKIIAYFPDAFRDCIRKA